MADLNLNTTELTSTLRTAPLNGAPSSSDYNDSQRETLVDLATLANFINNIVLPLFNSLPDTALLPSNSPVGIEGRTILTDTSDLSNLFFDNLASSPLTIADTIRVISGIVGVARQELTDLGIEVASLQARLSSTNQNDISLALQNLSSSINQILITQQTHNTQISSLQIGSIELQVNGVNASSQNILNLTGTGIAITDNGSGEIHLSLYTPLAFTSSVATPNTLEVGDTLSSVSMTWGLNKVVTSLGFTAVDSHMTPSAPFSLSTGATSQTFTGAYSPSSPLTSTWTLTASDGTSTTTANLNVNFEQKNYWGATVLTSLASSDILALGSNTFSTARPRTITYDCTGGKYPVYAYPSAYGDPASVTVGGLGFTDYSITITSVTNAHGYVSNYRVLRFNTLQHGSSITVVWN